MEVMHSVVHHMPHTRSIQSEIVTSDSAGDGDVLKKAPAEHNDDLHQGELRALPRARGPGKGGLMKGGHANRSWLTSVRRTHSLTAR